MSISAVRELDLSWLLLDRRVAELLRRNAVVFLHGGGRRAWFTVINRDYERFEVWIDVETLEGGCDSRCEGFMLGGSCYHLRAARARFLILEKRVAGGAALQVVPPELGGT